MHKGPEIHTEGISTIYNFGMPHWSENLKREMRQRGMSVPDLAREMGKPNDAALLDRLYKYVQGKVDQPRGSALQEIAQVFDLSLTHI